MILTMKLPGIMGVDEVKQVWSKIKAHLTFAPPRGTDNGWSKVTWLDEILRRACRDACGITQHFEVDESMIKCLSEFCKWIMYMPKKPIKCGIKVFCLVLSIGFVYNWHVYRGKEDPLCGANYMYRLSF